MSHLFADDMILNIENPKDSTKKSLELINEFSKIVGYKNQYMEKIGSVFIHNDKVAEKQIEKIISFTITTKK